MTPVVIAVIVCTLIICASLFFTVKAIGGKRDDSIKEAVDDIKAELEKQHLQSVLRLRDISSSALSSTEETLRKRNTEQLDAILSPLKEKIDNFNRLMSNAHLHSEASTKSLNDRIDSLLSLNMKVSAEASRLSSALRGNNSVQGKWGEIVLESLLEKAGLKKGVNYDTQVAREENGAALLSDEGRQLRPDVIIHLPGGRNIIIDSKVSLTAYLEYSDAKTDERRMEMQRRHVESVKRQIDILASKNYQKAVRNSADQVLLFIPNDAAYVAAMHFDNNLWKYALDKKITIVSSAHLFAVLQLADQLWRQESQNNNALEIASLGGMLYDSVVAFSSDMAKIEQHLKSALDAFSSASSRLSESNRSVLARAERLRELGVKTARRLKIED